jgi:hypothetical protein
MILRDFMNDPEGSLASSNTILWSCPCFQSEALFFIIKVYKLSF